MNSNNPSRSQKSRKPTDKLANAHSAKWIVPVLVGLITFVVFLPDCGTMRGDIKDSLEEFQKVVQIDPNYLKPELADAHVNLARALAAQARRLRQKNIIRRRCDS
jgi:hypothetical protein